VQIINDYKEIVLAPDQYHNAYYAYGHNIKKTYAAKNSIDQIRWALAGYMQANGKDSNLFNSKALK